MMPKKSKDRSRANVSDVVLKEENTKIAKRKLTKQVADGIKLLAECINDPVRFGEEVIGSKYYDYQKNVLNALAKYDRVVWRAAHGVGKSYTAADAALWWLFTRPESVVVTTASVWRQVEKILWAEIRSKAKKMNLAKIGWDEEVWPVDVLTTQIKISDKWYATGESSDTPEKMEGFHSQHILYIVDEAKAVKKDVFDAIEGALSTGEAKMLVISTPGLAPEGYFYELFAKPKEGWARFHTSAYDSPNVSAKWIEEKKKEWGEDNPVYISKVLGEFPTKTTDTLIPLRDIEAAIDREVDTIGVSELGVDVARFGDDETVIVNRQGQRAEIVEIITKMDTVFVAGKVQEHHKRLGCSKSKIDADGLGAGVFDMCKANLGEDAVFEFHGGAASADSDRWLNLRAQAYDNLRDLFKAGNISIPDDDQLIAQLANIKYKFTTKGQLQIESKEEMKKRGLKSPDRADTLAMAFIDIEEVDSEYVEPSIRRL